MIIVGMAILLAILVVSFAMLINSRKYKCAPNQLVLRYVRASRLPGANYSERLGIDTVNLRLDREVPCGIYRVRNIYGSGIMFVGSTDQRAGYMNMKNMALIKGINLFDLWDLQRMDASDNQLIGTYNKGCC